MKDLTIGTLLAVFEEMYGVWLWWLLVIIAVGITLVFFYIMIRDRRFKPKDFLWAQLASPFGAIAAVWFVQWITSSSFSDIGGPIDVIVLLGVAAIGASGTVIWAYVAQSLFARGREKS